MARLVGAAGLGLFAEARTWAWADQPLSGLERREAVDYLTETRDALVAIVSRLTPAEWSFHPDAGTWSAADNLEHIVVVEEQLFEMISTAITREPERPAADRPRVKDHVIPLVVTNRERRRFQAPEEFRPTGRWPTAKARLAAFRTTRDGTLAYVQTTEHDLRSRAWENPLVGLIDGYQWLLFVAGHSARHTKQIRDLLARPDFARIRS
jgi:hypothetical protein